MRLKDDNFDINRDRNTSSLNNESSSELASENDMDNSELGRQNSKVKEVTNAELDAIMETEAPLDKGASHLGSFILPMSLDQFHKSFVKPEGVMSWINLY